MKKLTTLAGILVIASIVSTNAMAAGGGGGEEGCSSGEECHYEPGKCCLTYNCGFYWYCGGPEFCKDPQDWCQGWEEVSWCNCSICGCECYYYWDGGSPPYRNYCPCGDSYCTFVWYPQ